MPSPGVGLANSFVATAKGTLFAATRYTTLTFISLYNINVISQVVILYILRGGVSTPIGTWTLTTNQFQWPLSSTDGITLSPGDELQGETTTASAAAFLVCGKES